MHISPTHRTPPYVIFTPVQDLIERFEQAYSPSLAEEAISQLIIHSQKFPGDVEKVIEALSCRLNSEYFPGMAADQCISALGNLSELMTTEQIHISVSSIIKIIGRRDLDEQKCIKTLLILMENNPMEFLPNILNTLDEAVPDTEGYRPEKQVNIAKSEQLIVTLSQLCSLPHATQDLVEQVIKKMLYIWNEQKERFKDIAPKPIINLELLGEAIFDVMQHTELDEPDIDFLIGESLETPLSTDGYSDEIFSIHKAAFEALSRNPTNNRLENLIEFITENEERWDLIWMLSEVALLFPDKIPVDQIRPLLECFQSILEQSKCWPQLKYTLIAIENMSTILDENQKRSTLAIVGENQDRLVRMTNAHMIEDLIPPVIEALT